MKRRKPFRSLEEIEKEMTELREWREGHEKRLIGCDDGTAVFRIISHGVAGEVRIGDPSYQTYVDDTIRDVGGIVWAEQRKLRRLQKEHRKVSRFLARRERKQALKADEPVRET